MGCVSSSAATPDLPALATAQYQPPPQHQQQQLQQQTPIGPDQYALSSTPRSLSDRVSAASGSPQSRPLEEDNSTRNSDADSFNRSRSPPFNLLARDALQAPVAAPAREGVTGEPHSLNSSGGTTDSTAMNSSSEIPFPQRTATAVGRSVGNDSLSDNPELLALVAAASGSSLSAAVAAESAAATSAAVNGSCDLGSSDPSSCRSLSMTGFRNSREGSGMLGRASGPSNNSLMSQPAPLGIHAVSDVSTSIGPVFNDEHQPNRHQHQRSVARCIEAAGQNDDGRAAPVHLPNQVISSDSDSGVSAVSFDGDVVFQPIGFSSDSMVIRTPKAEMKLGCINPADFQLVVRVAATASEARVMHQ